MSATAVSHAIAAVLSNWFLVLFAIAICTTAAKVRRLRLRRKPVDVASVAWGEVLFYNVGIGFVYGGIFHAYFQQIAAPSIGWQPSPFEYELGWMEIPLGLVAMTSLWRGFEFRLASTIVFAIFSLAASAQHIQEIVCCRNDAPSNAGLVLWFGDLFLPMLTIVLAALSGRESARS
jgi:hypothetical protein